MSTSPNSQQNPSAPKQSSAPHSHEKHHKVAKSVFSHHSFDSSSKLLLSVFVILIFMTIEIVGGIMANSLALLADAGHMASDFLALLLSWFSQRYAQRPPDQKRSYGYQRIKIIAAFVNSVALFVIAVLIIKEAVERFFGHDHGHVDWKIMLPVAICGAIANIVIYFLLSSCKDKTLNIRSAVTHVVGDLLGSCVAIIGSLVIKFTGWTFVDPILSLLVVAIIIKIAVSIVREALHILLEGTPAHMSNHQIETLLLNNLGLVEVHHIHIWSLSEEAVLATLHLVIRKNTIGEAPQILRKAKELLHGAGITHATIELEEEGWPCSDNKGQETV